jgi:putative transposase
LRTIEQMPIPNKYQVDFSESIVYHVYNRTNNKERLFLNDENYQFFLQKYDDYLSEYLETFAWCLLPNHFHLMVKVRPAKEIANNLKNRAKKLSLTEADFLENQDSLSKVIEHSFKRFFQSYAQSFNKVNNRKGNLFYKPFKRLEIEKESYFTQVIIYIHANPVKHKLVKDFTKWKWSSWKTCLSESPTKLNRKEVIDWFGGKEQFIKNHQELSMHYYDSEISIDD